LAHHRKAEGLPAIALDWGYWDQRSALTAHLDAKDIERMSRAGMRPLPPEVALALFDEALRRSDAALLPVRLDIASLRARSDALPPLFHKIVRPKATRAIAVPDLKELLAALSPEDRERALLDRVRAEVAAILGLPPQAHLDAGRPLQELGLDSLTAVEIRNR